MIITEFYEETKAIKTFDSSAIIEPAQRWRAKIDWVKPISYFLENTYYMVLSKSSISNVKLLFASLEFSRHF